MPTFRKKPVEIEARLFDNTDNEALLNWINEHAGTKTAYELGRGIDYENALIIPTLEGDHRADIGDMIIKGVAGEFYPCKPDIFAATYDAV